MRCRVNDNTLIYTAPQGPFRPIEETFLSA